MRTITALFDSIQKAEKAASDLAMQIGGVRASTFGSDNAHELASLSAIPASDHAALNENIRRGGGVVHAQVPDNKFEAVTQTLEADGALDFNEQEAAWRRDGWTGGSTTTETTTATTGAGLGTTASGGAIDAGAGTTRQQTLGATAASQGIATGHDQAIPIVEERLEIGKRQVAGGTVRVRSYVTETPVTEQVSLHSETVQVDRRPVDRAVAEADFRERTIEATETTEQAVVSKEARVTEEVLISKQVENTTQTVSDTVRRTEVEIEDNRTTGAHGTTGTTGTTTGTTGTTPDGRHLPRREDTTR